ncbi:hypothetical protein DDB_G0292652 [Dictyostelium discoideum AX4]|uniref:Uncharacterized protein n=1 Tax=Dictyostelium discoideum TaxID=44689 RepID=Q54CW8_DICDI|nr:hypothetical protein DDB_G0292652 [Dictyostelium discoideum AX4]EAL61129.1 hypothetical protein DDB_G0292652 [Dictyostelium discoideum AX4]|eukprot:XP_629552.1 hypothetical protein DDB_G0292652 [Dictyostelium discoideum AX4]
MAKPWLDEETEYLKELYYHHYQKNKKEKINCNKITQLVNERFANDRSPQAIKDKAHRLKISKKYATKTDNDYDDYDDDDDDDDNDNDYDGRDNNEDSQKIGKINFDDQNVNVKEEIYQQPVKTTISVSILDDNNNKNNKNENSVQTITTTTTKKPEIDTPPITNATTTTKNLKKLKKDSIEVEIKYLKKRLDYLTEKLNNLEI